MASCETANPGSAQAASSAANRSTVARPRRARPRVHQLLAVAHEDGALPDHPEGRDQEGAPIGLGHKAAHEIRRKFHEGRRFLTHEFAIYGGRSHCFPIEYTQVPAELVACHKRSQLVTDKFAERLLARHRCDFLGVGQLVFGESAKGRPQHFAVKTFLAPKMVIDGGLVDAGLGDDGPTLVSL